MKRKWVGIGDELNLTRLEDQRLLRLPQFMVDVGQVHLQVMASITWHSQIHCYVPIFFVCLFFGLFDYLLVCWFVCLLVCWWPGSAWWGGSQRPASWPQPLSHSPLSQRLKCFFWLSLVLKMYLQYQNENLDSVFLFIAALQMQIYQNKHLPSFKVPLKAPQIQSCKDTYTEKTKLTFEHYNT